MRDDESDNENQSRLFSETYKKDPTIELYVRLRRENPVHRFEVGVIGGLDQFLSMVPELEKHGLDPTLVADVMDADPEAISELSLKLLEKMIEAKFLLKRGKTHLGRRGLAIPEELMDWLIKCMLDAMSWNDRLYLSRDLIVLIRERLGGSKPQYRQTLRVREMRERAIFLGAQIVARGETPSFWQLGRIFGVAASTVKRWFPEGDFMQQAQFYSRFFDARGNLKADGHQAKKG